MPQKKTSNGAAETAKKQPKTTSAKSGSDDLTRKAKGSDKTAAKNGKVSAKTASNGSASGTSKGSAKAEKPKSEKAAKSVGKAKKPAVGLKKSAGVSKKYHKNPSEDSGISCKTPQVMKLVSEDNGENAVIAAGKSRMPARLKGREPLSRIVKREMHGDVYEANEIEVVNLTELAVKYEAPQILDRFNACSCEKCVAVFSEMVLKKLPARFARITKTKLGIRSRELSGRVEPVREMVQITMIRELIRSRKRIFHDE
ncbi:MAG: hypothetical protein MSR67_03955 [Oscillospiraceae bacterium]|nr:hypothetical protein [Oscillospiraceae bacterium]